MCSHYQGIKKRELFFKAFGFYPTQALGQADIWPLYMTQFVARIDGVQGLSANSISDHLGTFGLQPHWQQPGKISRQTFNARSETMAEKPSFRDPWRKGQRCVMPAAVIYEPRWIGNRCESVAITHSHQEILLVAGLYEKAVPPRATEIDDCSLSCCMVTVNADTHPIMKTLHRPNEEKRMVALLEPDDLDVWLNGSPEQAFGVLKAFPAEQLVATQVQDESKIVQGLLFDEE